MARRGTTVQIIGIDVAREVEATRFDRKIVDGEVISAHPAREAILGRGLRKTFLQWSVMKLSLFHRVPMAQLPTTCMRLLALQKAAMTSQIGWRGYLHIADAQELLVLEGRSHEIVVIVSNINRVFKITKAIETGLSDSTLDVAPWQSGRQGFLSGDAGRQAGRCYRTDYHYAHRRYRCTEYGPDVGAGEN